MTQSRVLELSFSKRTLGAVRRAQALMVCRRLRLRYPAVAGVLNRISLCLGDELCAPAAREPLLIGGWGRARARIREAERDFRVHDPQYLVIALTHVLAPLDEALGLCVSAPDGARWSPERETAWQDWRKHHPGALCVRAAETAPEAARVVALQRWALGPQMLKIEAAKAWPDVAIAV